MIKRVESAVMKEVAEELGNTPAVARGPTSTPRRRGIRVRPHDRRRCPARRETKAVDKRQAILDSGTARLIRKVAKGNKG